MQQRRYRPGDVLDDYCPRERRITDHAIVAMIDDHIKQTRCCVCDADHEYKDGKVPPQRRKKPQAALFTQVLDGLQGPHPAARLPHQPEIDPDVALAADASALPPEPPSEMPVAALSISRDGHARDTHSGNGRSLHVPAGEPLSTSVAPTPVSGNIASPAPTGNGKSAGVNGNIASGPAQGVTSRFTRPLPVPVPVPAPAIPIEAPVVLLQAAADDDAQPIREDGPVRRPLIRATLPRPEGQPLQPTRVMPEFTVRQPTNARGGHRPAGPGGAGRRRGGPQQGQGAPGPMSFGRSDRGAGRGQGHAHGHGQPQGQRSNGGRSQGANGGRPAGPRRGGKKR